jgi:hypothetical protein
MSEIENYKNISIEDLDNEQWIDAFNLDGFYEVSNLGRVKRLYRETVSSNGRLRILKEEIVNQHISKTKERIDSLICAPMRKSTNIGKLIFMSFYPKTIFNYSECVMHVDKNPLNNNINNLQKVTRKKSRCQDMLNSKIFNISVKENLEKAKKANEVFYNELESKVCNCCHILKQITDYPKKRKQCKKCSNSRKRLWLIKKNLTTK